MNQRRPQRNAGRAGLLCPCGLAADMVCVSAPERWPSGRRRTPGKCVDGEPSRGFESLSLRQPPALPAGFRSCTVHAQRMHRTYASRVLSGSAIGRERGEVAAGPGRGARASPPCPSASASACGRGAPPRASRRAGSRRRRGPRRRGGGATSASAPRARPPGSPGSARAMAAAMPRPAAARTISTSAQPQPLGQVRREAQAAVERVVDLEEGADARALGAAAVAKSASSAAFSLGKTPRAVASAATRARS